jgi:F-type H+-transporting ATPase subunit epsilon
VPFQVSLVSPEDVVFQGEAILVIARGTEGEFGIQTGHAPFLSALADGVVKIREPDGNDVRWTVHGGFLDMRDNMCTILADAIDAPET